MKWHWLKVFFSAKKLLEDEVRLETIKEQQWQKRLDRYKNKVDPTSDRTEEEQMLHFREVTESAQVLIRLQNEVWSLLRRVCYASFWKDISADVFANSWNKNLPPGSWHLSSDLWFIAKLWTNQNPKYLNFLGVKMKSLLTNTLLLNRGGFFWQLKLVSIFFSILRLESLNRNVLLIF